MLRLNPQQFKLIMDSIVWAIKHLERNASETGLLTVNGSNTCGGLNPSIVRGMTMIGGTIYFGQSTGVLSKVSFASGTTVTDPGTVGGAATPISGPLIDGNDWNSRALFARSDG